MLERNESFTYLEYLFAHDLMETDEQLEMENKFGICVQVNLCLNLVIYWLGEPLRLYAVECSMLFYG